MKKDNEIIQENIIIQIENMLYKNIFLQTAEKIDYKQSIKFFDPILLEYFLILIKDIQPKLLNLITNSEKQTNWKNYLDFLIPIENLNYKSEDEYLAIKDITIENVIENSIIKVFPEIDKDELSELIEKFVLLIKGHKIRVLKHKEIPVYLEIIYLMEYIKNISKLLKHYKKPSSNYRGTAHRSSSLKDIVKKQIRMLDERLNGVYFKIQHEDEIEQTEIALKILSLSQLEEHKNIIEQLNFARIVFGLDMKFWNFSKNDKIAVKQVTNFYNGAKTKPHELVRSFMIYMDVHFDKNNLPSKEKAEIILDITRFFYKKELEVSEKSKRNNLAFNVTHIHKPSRVKTLLHNIPIYSYQYKDQMDFLDELLELGFNDMMGLKNILGEDKPTLDEASSPYIVRNIIDTRKQFGFTKQELKVLIYFASKSQTKQEQKKLLDISSNN